MKIIPAWLWHYVNGAIRYVSLRVCGYISLLREQLNGTRNETRSLVSNSVRVFFALCGLVNISKQSFLAAVPIFHFVIQACTEAMRRGH